MSRAAGGDRIRRGAGKGGGAAPPARGRAPVFRELSGAECRALLRRNNVGRLCFTRQRAVDVEPVHYVARGRWIFVRSAEGTKLRATARNPYVAFEVDEIDGLFDWSSVVIKGTIYFLTPDGAPIVQRELTRALRALRTLVPETLEPDDPTPFRRTIYGIHVDEMTGRAATTTGRTRSPVP